MDDSNETKPRMRDGWKGVWRHVRPHKRTLVVLAVLGLVSAVANGLVPYISGRFFDALIHIQSGQRALGFPLWAVLLGAWTLIQVAANGTDWIKDRLRRALDLKVRLGIEIRGFGHLMRLPMSFHTNAKVSGEVAKINNGAWRITAIVRSIIEIAPQFLSVVIGITLAITINPVLAGVLALGVFVYVGTLIPMLIPIAEADEVAHKKWNEAWGDASEAIHQVTSVKQSVAEGHQEEKLQNGFMGVVYGLWMRLEYTWSNISFYQRIIVFLTQLCVFVVSVNYISTGVITVGELVALNGYSMMFFGPFVQLGYSWQVIQNGLTAAVHLETILSLPVEEYEPKGAQVAETRSGEVIFENVEFMYEEGKGGVLRGVSFATKPGEVIALVGESGAGKSTAISLISGYYFPTHGNVRIDGVDTRVWNLTELRSRIAIVPQEVALFNDTIGGNIRYGSFNASEDEVKNAAMQAHIDEFIQTLPKGYDTLVGERGVKLSVGQKQRVAIARAILRNPEILILDEPTSALDSGTERQITESLEKLMQGRTTFIIAHRLSTVRKADKILFLKDGTISEQGTHDELMAIENGGYRHLYELHAGMQE